MSWIARFLIALYVFLYRRTRGATGGRLNGMPVLLLTTTGRKTGKRRTVPVMYLKEGVSYVVTASNGGREKHPAWWLNLEGNPQAMIEVEGVHQSVVAASVGPEEKRRLWTQLVEQAPFFEDYQKRASREIPMVILRAADRSGA